MKSLFRAHAKAGGKLRLHGLRKRAITLTTLATQSVDATAQAIGIDPQAARTYYLDARAAFSGTEVLKRMAGVLRGTAHTPSPSGSPVTDPASVSESGPPD
ncbi:MAG: hypothetical protein ABGY75_15330 [Gemmataceae bacterium]